MEFFPPGPVPFQNAPGRKKLEWPGKFAPNRVLPVNVCRSINPSPDLGVDFHGYVAAGIEDDHEGTRVEDAIARVRRGMKAMLRYGSAWHDVETQIDAILEHQLDSRRFILCTDDSHVETLAQDGHMDRVLRHALGLGLPPMIALQMMTINTAEHFGLTREIGMIAPGRWADVLLVGRSAQFLPGKQSIAKGARSLAQTGANYHSELPEFGYPGLGKKSGPLGESLSESHQGFLAHFNRKAQV